MASLPGRDLQIEPGGQEVLRQDLPRSARHSEHERHARDGPVLHPLRAGRADSGEAPCLEVEHRLPLRVTHQRLRAAAGREPHLHAPRGVGGGEECLRPRRVVAVDEHRLRAVHRQRLGVRHEPLHGQLEIAAFLDRALRHHAGAAGLRADEQRDRVERRVAGDSDRRLELGEAARRRLGGVGGEQGGALLEVRDVRLVGRSPPRAQLLEREHHLDGVEAAHDPRQPRGSQAAAEPDELVPRVVDVDQATRELAVGKRRRLRRRLEIDASARDERVEHVEVLLARAVDLDDSPVLDREARLRVVRAVHRHEPELRVRRDQQLAPELALLPRPEAARPCRDLLQAALASRTPRSPPARTLRTAAPRPRRAARPRLRARPRSSGAAAAPCRSRGSCRTGSQRARRRDGGCPPALSARPPPPLPPGGEASPASPAGLPTPACRSRMPSTVTSSSGRPDGVVTASGRFWPSG